MKNIAMLWAKDKKSSVVSSKIREFRIYDRAGDPRYWEIRAWFNKDESFYFGRFDSSEEARDFLSAIHEQIEGRNESELHGRKPY